MNPNHTPISIIHVVNLNFSYPKGETILENVSFDIYEGEIIGIAGKSGIGKTTLGYILKGLIPHTFKGKLDGKVEVAGYDIKKTKIAKLAKEVGMVFQNLNAQLFNTSVMEEIEFGLRNLKLNLDWAQEAIEFLGIAHLADKMPMNLSAGQKQRVVLASIIAMHPKVLILDEPTAHLDEESKFGLKKWLEKLNQHYNMTILIIEQDPWILGEMCNRLIQVSNKNISSVSKDSLLEKKPSWCWK